MSLIPPLLTLTFWVWAALGASKGIKYPGLLREPKWNDEGVCEAKSFKEIANYDEALKDEILGKEAFVVMGSPLYYQWHAWYVLQKPPSDLDEKTMCLSLKWDPDNTGDEKDIAILYAVNTAAIIRVKLLTRASVDGFSPGNPNIKIKLVTTWTDGKVAVACGCARVNGRKLKLWAAYSTTKTIPEATQTSILEHVKSKGFDEGKAVVSESESCLKTSKPMTIKDGHGAKATHGEWPN